MSDCFDHGFDAFESYFNEDNYQSEENPKRCKHCGKNGLYWKEINGKWKLCENNFIHNCEDIKIFNRIEEQKRVFEMNIFQDQYEW